MTAGSTPADADAASEKTIPLGVGGEVIEETALDPLLTAGETKKFKAGSLVLIAVIVIGCAGIWFMKTMSKVSAASSANRDIEATIEKFITGMKGGASKTSSGNSNALAPADANILAVLSGSYIEKQIPLDGVQRNPFILFGEEMTGGGPIVDDSAGMAARRRGEIERASTQLELKSVLMGTQPLANIGGKIVRKGEEIVVQPDNITFRVTEITKDSVTVVGEDARLNLSVPVTLFIKR